ncbi:hypothetical protein MMC17_010087 [Xylographa soralifera]|nr:hypothetical protein [Xylographa soralifera]
MIDKDLGHALSFFKDQDGTLSRGRKYFQDTREPFSITLAGEKLYVLCSPHDVTAAYRNSTTLTYDLVIRDLLEAFGVSHSGVDKLYRKPTDDEPAFQPKGSITISQNKSVGHLKGEFYHYQLYPGEQFDFIQARFLKIIDTAMRPANFTSHFVVSSTPQVTKVSLHKWCQHVLVTAGTTAFFGETLLQMYPDLLQNFVDFDDYNWMVWYKWPDATLMRTPKAKVLKTLEEYLALPKEKRSGVAWIIETMEDSQRNLGMNESDIAAVVMTLLWVINTNTYKMAFWILSYMLFSPVVYDRIRSETNSAILPDGSIDLSRLMSESPHLDSLWMEVMRLTNSSAAVRTVMQPTPIGNKMLRPGHKVMSPFRQLHFNEDVFGKSANQCDPDRFFNNSALAKDPSYRPFGGGSTFCPGRFIARQEVFIFVALAVHRFGIELATPTGANGGMQTFPQLESKKPTTGIMSPQAGEDLLVTVRQISKA